MNCASSRYGIGSAALLLWKMRYARVTAVTAR